MKKRKMDTLVLASILSLATSSQAYAEPRISSVVDAKPDFLLTAQERESLSLSAGQLLIHVDRARDALHLNDQTRAKQEVDKALTLARILKTTLPTFTVKTKVDAGTLHYEDDAKVQPPLVTLHEELNTVAILKPIRNAKKEQEKKDAITQGRPLAADIELRESRAQLNVDLALVGLEAAQRALSENKTNVAEGALTAVQTGVVFEHVVADLPLERARLNLFLARQAVKSHNSQEVTTTLNVAVDALEEYEKMAGSMREKEIAALRKEIEALTRSGQGQAVSEDTINKWWQTIASWAE
jgi:hypothetical protein